ncbi:hypothetical protein FNJ88_00745 [Chryseobacterium sp. SNU WT5]|uniref:hypothetical protein n=1 Tax=Chryseobacterium sp. SNU WT5 TaxID=2594269 RepID=UPI00117FFEB7|nr:hypothetical protein [Chryseobacterium sp. SNU WT5]QDP84153.1 hypothetical protein FNJ88_00745 [Chryseobacterium sp. SNU WT5]
MKNTLAILALFMSSVLAFGQEIDLTGFNKTEIESGITYKKYKEGKLDQIILRMMAENYGNTLFFSKSKDAILITNAADENSLIKIELKNGKQVRTFFYKKAPIITIEGIDFDLVNLPKDAVISTIFSNNLISSNKVSSNYEALGDDNPDKTLKLFSRLEIKSDLNELDSVFDQIGDFFSQEDALLKIFYGRYAEKFQPKILGSIETDHFGKIKEGIIWDFKSGKISGKNKYETYSKGKVVQSGLVNLDDFQEVFMKYQIEKSDEE